VEIEWLVGPDERDVYDLYAVVRADGVREINEDNNTVSLKIVTADAAITDVKCENLAGDDYLVTATLANEGSTILKGMKAQLEHALKGEVLDTISVHELNPGEEAVLNFLFPLRV